jgi:hypothetical protein
MYLFLKKKKNPDSDKYVIIKKTCTL